MPLPSKMLYRALARKVFLKEKQRPNAKLEVGIFDGVYDSQKQLNFIQGLNKPKIKNNDEHNEQSPYMKDYLKEQQTTKKDIQDFFVGNAISYDGY